MRPDAATRGPAAPGCADAWRGSSRPRDRDEALQLALAGWGPEISEPLRAFDALPAARRRELGDFAVETLLALPRRADPDPRVGERWLCTLLPSHLARIRNLPGVQFDSVTLGAMTNPMVSHPQVLPGFGSDADVSAERQRLIEDLRRRAGP